VTDLAGRVVDRISPRTQNLDPSLTRDGRHVAFARNVCDRDGRCDRAVGIWTATLPRGTLRQVAPPGCCPRLSRDGTRVAYVEMTYGRGRIDSSLRVVPAAGGVRRGRFLARLGGANFMPPAWSPDSRMIAVVDEKGGLLILNASAGVRATRVSAVGVVIGFAWSPDSSRLLVAARRSARACISLWLVNATTAAARVLRRCG
jgi:Tol biopolymer transport system component